jgi:Helix-turn-helix of DDE superfamily endonuclease
VVFDRHTLAQPALTGMSTTALSALTNDLDQIRQAHHAAQQHAYRVGLRATAPRSGRPPRLPLPDQVLATILHLRQSLPEDTLATLFNTSRPTIRRAIRQTRALLDEHGTTIEPDPDPHPIPLVASLRTTPTTHPATQTKKIKSTS